MHNQQMPKVPNGRVHFGMVNPALQPVPATSAFVSLSARRSQLKQNKRPKATPVWGILFAILAGVALVAMWLPFGP